MNYDGDEIRSAIYVKLIGTEENDDQGNSPRSTRNARRTRKRCQSLLPRATGFDEVSKPSNLAARGGCWFENGGVRVHLGVEANFAPARKAHPGFIVDDLSNICATLEKAGFPTISDEPLEGYLRKYVSDPFGNRIELMQIIAI